MRPMLRIAARTSGMHIGSQFADISSWADIRREVPARTSASISFVPRSLAATLTTLPMCSLLMGAKRSKRARRVGAG